MRGFQQLPKSDEVIKFNRKPLKGAIVYVPSPVSKFLADIRYPYDAPDQPVIHYGSDISVLLNQQRLQSKEFAEIANDIMSRARSSDLSDKYSHLSDDDILSCVKSRYVQAPSEVQQWTQYLMSQLDNLADAAAEKAAAENAAAADTSTSQTE
ncbi:internal scaffolding protein [Peromfec virus RodF8_16]|uniref:Internal scaffolding protein n=1 Tax=Peromfec virus RodF8_16 TaxID=2929360 RepID=A0A976R8A1_9VIRU|nr:internal scaffolding protein [Peromfec virus RodF8_16]